MSDLVDALGLPFMQRALAAGLLVGLTTSLVGVLVILRRAAFFGDAIAHASLAGVALGIVAGVSPLATAGAVGVGIGLGVHHLERGGRLSLDTVLGFVLPFFMALGVLILSLAPGYRPELLSYLFGSILAVSRERLAVVAAVALIAIVVLARWRGPLVYATFDAEAARASGVRVDRLLVLFHVLLALVVIASISTVGIVLVNALLIIPAATAKLLAGSLAQMFVLAPIVGTSSVVVGLLAAYALDLPSGPAVAVTAGLVFLGAWSRRLVSRRGLP